MNLLRVIRIVLVSVASAIGHASSPELADLEKQASSLFAQRQYGPSADRYRLLRVRALEAKETKVAARSLSALANCHYGLFQYREAIRLYEQAHGEAKASKDASLERVIAGNIASLLNALGETDKALRFVRDYPMDGGGLRPESRLDWQLMLVQIHGRAKQRSTFDQAVRLAFDEAARPAPESAIVLDKERHARYPEAVLELRRAAVLDVLSDASVDFGDLAKAAIYAEEAFRIRCVYKDPLRLRSLVQLAVLARKSGQAHEALRLAGTALTLEHLKPSPMQKFRMHREKGLALMSLARPAESLEEFRRALAFPRAWRSEVLPSDSAIFHYEAYLNGEIHRDFLNAVVALPPAMLTKELAAETFWVAEEARFASMRAAYFPRDEIAARLGPDYWPLLEKFQSLQTAMMAGDTRGRAERDQIELKLVQMEAQAGLSIPHAPAMPKAAFSEWQAKVPTDESVFSYFLSEPRSLGWAVSRHSIELRLLPGKREMSELSERFSKAVKADDRVKIRSTGNSLTRKIFGEFSYHHRTTLFWTVVVEDSLAQTPISALPVPEAPERFLVEAHTLRFLPSAMFLAHPVSHSWTRTAAGFADPVYNVADSRITGTGRSAGDSWQLSRLPASAKEIEAGFAPLRQMAWSTRLTTGQSATVSALRTAVADAPDVLHVATHFSADAQRPDLVAIALASPEAPEAKGQPALFSERDLAGLRTRSKVVVLDGCASASGLSYPGVGIVGLSRGWLISGAGNVVGTLWPIEDVAGPFFPAFYRRLGSAPYNSRAAASALRDAQLAMLKRMDRFSQARHWAAYTVLARS